ncbi:NAD(P)H-dependent oxidoreductase [Paracoccus sp. Z118]|uniref:NAD(P)H-dependent oxidoreductase n=1 Tax=Paracoccus sp. Z118 TaxID=2851017 RepID=UPI001C2B939E|nr:NAD(P)H-dependent oxidoreductase [Paracoccus sp. Z118]MBV0892751.1 NAD(P)H-dependent oxidoreductase [Paracoccus sp. Z118]
MRVLILDGHPDGDRLTQALLDVYESGLPEETEIARIAVRDLDFDPNLRRGYETIQEWEPDLHLIWQAMLAADHIVLGFPLWWGAEPARLKGLWDRLLLPAKAFSVDEGALLPEPMLAGRSVDLVVTMDTPPLLYRLVMRDPLGARMGWQVLGYCGLDPIRRIYLGRVREGAAGRNMPRWRRRLADAAATAPRLRRRPVARRIAAEVQEGVA